MSYFLQLKANDEIVLSTNNHISSLCFDDSNEPRSYNSILKSNTNQEIDYNDLHNEFKLFQSNHGNNAFDSFKLSNAINQNYEDERRNLNMSELIVPK